MVLFHLYYVRDGINCDVLQCGARRDRASIKAPREAHAQDEFEQFPRGFERQ